MQAFRKLNNLLRSQNTHIDTPAQLPDAYAYARCMAEIEGVVAVVSDIARSTSRIFCGAFASRLGLENYNEENSIWERQILELMPESEQQEKFMAELRFHHNLMQRPLHRRHCCLMTRLRMKATDGQMIDVMHKMLYIFDPANHNLRYAICLYSPATPGISGRSIIVDTLTGLTEELTSATDAKILSPRERQVLSLIDSGLTSEAIARQLNISRHTVNRHRQEIILRLKVRNSIEACRIAKSMHLI